MDAVPSDTWRRFNLLGLIFDFDTSKISNTIFHMVMELASQFPDVYVDGVYQVKDLEVSPSEAFSTLEFLTKLGYAKIVTITPALSALKKLLLPTYLTCDMAFETQQELVDYSKFSEPIYITRPSNLLFASNPKELKFLPQEEALKALEVYKHFLISPHLVIVGSTVFNAIIDRDIGDIILCVHGCDENEASRIVTELLRSLTIVSLKQEKSYIEATISTVQGYRRITIVTCIYSSLAAITLDLDIDCECLAYDGRSIWLSPRAVFALKGQYNTVNLNICREGYVDRLLAYATSGMMVHDLGYDPSKYNIGTTGDEKMKTLMLLGSGGGLNFLISGEILHNVYFSTTSDDHAGSGEIGPTGPTGLNSMNQVVSTTGAVGFAGPVGPVSLSKFTIIWSHDTIRNETATALIRQRWYAPPVSLDEKLPGVKCTCQCMKDVYDE